MTAPEKNSISYAHIFTGFAAAFVVLIILGSIARVADNQARRDAETIGALEARLAKSEAEVALGYKLFAELLNATLPALSASVPKDPPIELLEPKPIEATDWSNWFNSMPTGIVYCAEATNAPSR